MKRKTGMLGIAFILTMVAFLVFSGCAPTSMATTGSTTSNSASDLNKGKSGAAVLNAEPHIEMLASNEAQKAADKHLAYSVQCASCHAGDTNPLSAPATDESCRSCHSIDELVEATADLKNRTERAENPHDSHIGDVNCLLCHSNHSDSQNYCLTCHPEPEYQDIDVP